jgi:hypothetical protein
MASANIELVRSIYADWDRKDFRRVDWTNPAIEFVTFSPLAGHSVGLSKMGERWRDFFSKSVPDPRRPRDQARSLPNARAGVHRGWARAVAMEALAPGDSQP